jgi:hypothetical protein
MWKDAADVYFKVLHQHSSGENEENHEETQDSQFTSRDSNPGLHVC